MEAREVSGLSPYMDSIEVTATKEEWRNVIDKLKFIPDHAIRDDSFSDLVHWLINQGVYE